MRKRVRIGRATKILSCVNGRIVRYTFIAMCAIMLGSCGTSQEQDYQFSTWSVYCKKYHVDPINATDEQEDYYLDCYVGSAEGECDLMRTESYNYRNEER